MPRLVLVILLAVSFALNVVLLLRGRAHQSSTAAPPACPIPAPSTPTSATPTLHAWPTVPHTPRPAADAAAIAAPPSGPIDDEVQQSVLCAIAEHKVAEVWQKDSPAITESLRRSLIDRDEQERNVKQNAAELEELLRIPESQRSAFTEQYRERRLARVDEAARAVAQTPPDYAAVTRAVAGLFGDEDALALKYAGEPGRDQLRANELEGRTTLLAIAAALAGLPLESVRW